MRLFLVKRFSILLLLCGILFLFGNGLFSLSDPDEAFYSLTAHEMAAHHEWMTPLIFGQPQFEKPPLTYWLIEFAFKTWGESPATARLFPAIFACLGVLAVYLLGIMGFNDERKAFLSAIVLATSMFFVAMGKTVFTDMIFTVFILLAMTSFVWAFTNHRSKEAGLIGFYVACGLAILTKGPLGFIIPQFTVILFLLYQRQIHFLKSWAVAAGLVIFLVISLPWYLYIYQQYGHAFIHEFFYNDHWRRLLTAEHRANDRWFFYPLTMVGGLFPWSLFLVAAWVDLFKRMKSHVSPMDYLSLSWVIAALLIFQTAHSKLASYILPLFPALALMTGNFLGNCLSQIQHRKNIQHLLSASFAVLAVVGIVVVAGHHLYYKYIPSLLPGYFLSGALIALAGVGVTLAFKEDFQPALYLLSLTFLPILLTAFLIRPSIEGYISSHEASEYIPKSSVVKMTVLTSKNNARGIRLFTDQDIAVVDYSNQPFFSPHPIPILSTTAEILNVIDKQKVTYGVIRKATYKDLLKNSDHHYRVDLLGTAGFDYIIKIQLK